jgi:peptide/nickel transport system permease protein
MLTYITRRLLQLPIILFGVTILIFGMMMLLSPYERLSLYLPDRPERGDSVDKLVELYGLDDPIPVQYGRWLLGDDFLGLAPEAAQSSKPSKGVLRGDLGFSYRGHQPVTSAIIHFLPATLELTLWAVFPVIGIGIQLGVWSAVHHDKLVDHVLRVFSIIGWSFPTYVFGLMALMIFYAKLDWFPASRLSEWALRITLDPEQFTQFTRMNTADALLNGRLDIFLDSLRHLVLPVITLSYLWWAQILRVTRSSMLEALRQDYVTTARAKGLPESVVINRHVRRNALIPVATIGGLVVIGLMSGVVITETVFDYRGLGFFFADSALHLDVVSVLGFTLFYAVLVVLGNLSADILYAFLDPRVRYT